MTLFPADGISVGYLNQAEDIDGRRHLVMVAGKPRRLTPAFWRLFTLLYE